MSKYKTIGILMQLFINTFTSMVTNKKMLAILTVALLVPAGVLAVSAPDNVNKEATGKLTFVDLGTVTLSTTDDPANVSVTNVSHTPIGNNFTVSTTSVTWNAIIVTGGSTSTFAGNQLVTVTDTTPPTMAPHADVTENYPIKVTYTTPTASDIVDGSVKVTCTPTSGTLLTVDTTVTCTAADKHSNTATSTFNVTVVNTLAGKVGTVIMTFDDGFKSNVQTVMPVLSANNQKGTAFIVLYDTLSGSPDYLNPTDLASLKSAGWDISAHTYTHCCDNIQNYLITANNSQLYHELVEPRDWLYNNGFGRGNVFFAYPYGCYSGGECAPTDTMLTTNLETAGYFAARTVESYYDAAPVKYTNGYVTQAERMKMSTMEDSQYCPKTSSKCTQINYKTSSDYITQINEAVNENGLIILSFHNVVGTPTAGNYDYPLKDFQNISDYLAALNKSGNVKVLTLSEYFNVPSVVTPFTPGSPIVGPISITNRNVTFSWTGSVGTDSYEVTSNGDTNYLATNNSIVVPALPGQTVTVSVVGINTTWGTRSHSPKIDMSTILPYFMPSSPVGITSTLGSTWVDTMWAANPVGNKTDSYNVNVVTMGLSTWTNGTTVTHINVTGASAGQTVDVKVYARNDTVVNEVPAELITTIPVTNVPVITSISQNSQLFTMTLKYQAGLNTDLVEITTIRNFENGTQATSVIAVPKLSGETGELSIAVTPHEAVNFSVRGLNSATSLYSASVNVYQVLNNNIVKLSIDPSYSVSQDSVFKLTPIINNADNDVLTFGATDLVDGANINPITGEFVFDTSNVGKYMFNISVNDNHGSSDTISFMLTVQISPIPTPCTICPSYTSAFVTMSSVPAGATASIDGKAVNTYVLNSPVMVGINPDTVHHIVMTMAGYDTYTQDINVAPDVNLAVIAVMHKTVTPPDTTPILRMSSVPVGATAYIDGKTKMPLILVQTITMGVPVGMHIVTMTYPGYDNWTSGQFYAADNSLTEIHAVMNKTVVQTPTPTPNVTATPIPIVTPNVTATPTPIVTPNVTATPIPTVTPNVTATPTPTVTPNVTATPTPTATPTVIKGDVNGDGQTTIVDALFVAQYTVGSRTLTPVQLAAADVNGDGQVTIVDALFIAQYTVGTRVL